MFRDTVISYSAPSGHRIKCFILISRALPFASIGHPFRVLNVIYQQHWSGCQVVGQSGRRPASPYQAGAFFENRILGLEWNVT
jgi:hypothetical protein